MTGLGYVKRIREAIADGMTDGLTIRFYSSFEIGAAEQIWRQMEAANPPGLTNSWDWIATYLNHYGDVVPHRFAVGASAAGVCGIALLTRGVGSDASSNSGANPPRRNCWRTLR